MGSRVSFCDGSFYDDSLLRPLSSPDGALPTCGPSLSQLKCPFSTQCASISFPVCMCFFFFYFSAVLLSWLLVFHSWCPSKRQKRRKNKNSWRYTLSWCLLNHCLGLLQQNKKWFDWYFVPIICVIFYIPNSLTLRWLMSYIYGAPIIDVSRSHTTTQHSR